MYENLVEAVVEMKEQDAIQLTKDLAAAGNDPKEILEAGTRAMGKVGELFEGGKYFLPELIMAGDMLTQISEVLKPFIQSDTKKETLGKVLIGTVAGDVHDIGKNIASFILDVNGFEVKDIGVDVPVDKFVEEIKDFKPQVVGLSSLLTTAYKSMKETVEAIEAAGIRNDIKIMIGGAQTSDNVAVYTGADAAAKDAYDGVNLTKKWICGE
jgi:methanogenic corrinoid protein MtbC1